MVTGYAGIFALWSLQSGRITPASSFGVGLLLAVSITAFVGWEIYGMVQRFLAMSVLRKSIDNPVRYSAEIKLHAQRTERLMRKFEQYWHPVIWVAAGCAALAMLILVSAFSHGLLLTYVPHVSKGQSAMELNFLSVVLGGIIAGIVGVVALRFEAWRNRKALKKSLATALESDLRGTVEIFDQVLSVWKSHHYISYAYLDQIAFIRANFNSDRPNFFILNDDDIRTRLNLYFRKSYATLEKLRLKQDEVYGVTRKAEQAEMAKDAQLALDIEEQKNLDVIEEVLKTTARDRDKALEELEEALEELREHRSSAIEIADQLTLRF
jgi:hypothetical protein